MHTQEKQCETVTLTRRKARQRQRPNQQSTSAPETSLACVFFCSAMLRVMRRKLCCLIVVRLLTLVLRICGPVLQQLRCLQDTALHRTHHEGMKAKWIQAVTLHAASTFDDAVSKALKTSSETLKKDAIFREVSNRRCNEVPQDESDVEVPPQKPVLETPVRIQSLPRETR